MFYRENFYEISAWSNNAYIEAYEYKIDNPNLLDREIVKHVLDKIHMTKKYLELAIETIKNNTGIFLSIVGVLIAHFSELNGNSGQSYFDKSVFELDIVKQMRKEVSKMIDTFDVRTCKDKIEQMIQFYTPELLKYKDIIETSFIKHMEYWFEKSQKQMTKSITLGIEDAS